MCLAGAKRVRTNIAGSSDDLRRVFCGRDDSSTPISLRTMTNQHIDPIEVHRKRDVSDSDA